MSLPRILLCFAFALPVLSVEAQAFGPGRGEMSKQTDIGYGCVAAVTVRWYLRTLFGEPVVGGSWKFDTGNQDCKAHYSTVVWLKVGPGWVKLNPLVPRANQGFGFNVAGSPNWGALICQPTIMNPRWFSATKGECISREEAEDAWRGESVSDFRMGWNGDQGSLEDRAQLSTFYHATDGPNWTRRSNWTAAAALSDWYGVSMDDGGRVTGLELRGNGLTGPIPPALGELPLLSILDLGARRSFFSGRLIENAADGTDSVGVGRPDRAPYTCAVRRAERADSGRAREPCQPGDPDARQ